MSLRIHRATRTDLLADGLADLLARPLADPFATELVVVPARGVERWLSQRLSHRLGVCAGVGFRSPRSLVAELTGTSDSDPWAPDALVWPLLEVIDTHLDEPWAASLARHLGRGHEGEEADLRRGRRYPVAARLARLFASYAVQRPQLLDDWSAGRDTDGVGGALDDDLTWQPELWRRLTATVGAPTPAQRHAVTLEALRAGSVDPLPARLSLFGHTRLPVTEIELLRALATHRDVHLWLPYPSEPLWRAVTTLASRGPALAVPRREDTSHTVAGHPLLARLARDSRELARALADDAQADDADRDDGDGSAENVVPPHEPDTLLGWLQHDVRRNQTAPPGRGHDRNDRSVQVHACHGAARQVEVLREVLLGLLADDPTLEPRDVLVMCPDIETYAPLVGAAFGLGDVLADVPGGAHPAHGLRVRLADRSLTQTNPLLAVASRLLDLAGGRARASEVLDLVQAEPVRRRFALGEEDLDTVTGWVRESGVHWAFDADHRAPFGLETVVANTWEFGVDRVLAGVAMSDDSHAWIGTALPLDDVGSNRIDLAGRLAELVDRIRTVVTGLEACRTLDSWLTTLTDGVDALTLVPYDDTWQVAQLRRELGAVLADADDRGRTEMRLADVRALLESHLAGRPTRASFRTGSLTVCTMVPMRSVPHRVVCLLGMDDGGYPRTQAIDGDDVLARRPMTGERDVRSEDRQLLLDAVLAATEHLVVTYSGAGEITGQPRPPAVPVGELLDALDRTTDTPVRDRVLVHHPLQPFDPRNLEPDALGTPHPFSFDPSAATAARASAGDRRPPVPFVTGQLPVEEPSAEVALDDLVRFFRDPVKGFFRALDLTLPWEVEEVTDAIPVDLDGLQRWSVGDRMLQDMLTGKTPEEALQAEWRRGTLPPGRFGWRLAKTIGRSAEQLARRAFEFRQGTPRSYDVDVELEDGRRLVGTVNDVYGHQIVDVGYSRLGVTQQLSAWIRQLALSAQDPDHNWIGITVGRAPRGDQPATRQSRPVDQRAIAFLSDLVRVRELGARAPLALPLRTGFAYATAARSGGDPVEAAQRQWAPKQWDGENADPAVVRAFGANQPIGRLLGPPLPGEEGAAGAASHGTKRLGVLAGRVFGPMLEFENGAI